MRKAFLTAGARKRWITLALLSAFLTGATVLLGLSPPQAGAQASPSYTVTDISNEDASFYPYDINDSGQIVGGSGGRAILYENGTIKDLGNLGGSGGSVATSINNSGQIVGDSVTAATSTTYQETHAFLYENGTMKDLGDLGGISSNASGINDFGQVVGRSNTSDNSEHSFLYENGTMNDLGIPGGSWNSRNNRASAINDSEQITGNADVLSSYEGNAFLHENGTWQDLGDLGGNAMPNDINDSGQVVGLSYLSGGNYHAFLYENGTMKDLGHLGSNYSWARSINVSGQVVGHSWLSGGNDRHAFLYENGSMQDLNSLLPSGSGWVLTDARSINSSGQIVGSGTYNGEQRSFLLTPCSEPSAQEASTQEISASAAACPVEDKTSPTVTSVEPENGATEIPVDANVSATFSEEMDLASVYNGFKVVKKGTTTPIDFASLAPDPETSNTVTFDPYDNLEPGTTYVVTVTGAKDTAGNLMDQDPNTSGSQGKTWSFTTESPLNVTSVKPESGATEVPLDTSLSATFSKPIQQGSINSKNFKLVKKGTTTPLEIASSSYDTTTRTVTYKPKAPLKPNTTYIATQKGVLDEDGNLMDQDPSTSGSQGKAWAFTTDSLLQVTSVPKEKACVNAPVKFTETGAKTANWSGGGTPATGTGKTFTTRFGSTGTHTVTATTAKGASESADITILESSSEECKVTVTFGANAVPEAVTEYSMGVLKDILRAANINTAQISSTSRDPYNQARVMYDNLEAYGVASQKELYGRYGDKVINVYVQAQKAGKTRDETIQLMEQKIYQVGPCKVSRHCNTPGYNVFDVAPSSIPQEKWRAFVSAVEADKRVARFLKPPRDPGYHLEIPQP